MFGPRPVCPRWNRAGTLELGEKPGSSNRRITVCAEHAAKNRRVQQETSNLLCLGDAPLRKLRAAIGTELVTRIGVGTALRVLVVVINAGALALLERHLWVIGRLRHFIRLPGGHFLAVLFVQARILLQLP